MLSEIKPASLADFLIIHSEKVGAISKIIAKKMGIDNEVFEIAGWVHDIGYSKNIEDHARFAIPILRDLGYETNEILEDCILNHGNGKTPGTIQGKIFQLSDKLSIFDSKIIESMINHGGFPLKNEDVDLLKNFSEKSFELLKNFEG